MIHKPLLFLLFSCFCLLMIQTTAWAQIREVKGTVTDSAGAPLASASVNVKDSKTGTVTGKDGSFFLNVPQTATTLV
ncbi:MAG TPA: carboxypeptidase-like regulatory domain-containing protein, partial [Niabella sp.]|nr:carboxypeptidase-like regulatory domain-containing protein [Niabella sp.]